MKKDGLKNNLRILTVVLLDLLILAAAGLLALAVRFEFSFRGIPAEYRQVFVKFL